MGTSDGPEAPYVAASGNYTMMVLLVDDQPIIGEAIRRALADQPNIHFHYCSNPLDAIKIAEQIKPTVILQDLVMPGVNGLTLVQEYRKNPATRDIPVIVLSTREEPVVKSESFVVGANDYLVKLPDKIELIARIRYHSKAYLNHMERDEAYRALGESQRQLQEKNLELERLTHVDGLTGLCNRRYFDELLAMQWKRAIRDKSPFTVLMIDVDNFKDYNDRYGHLAGDDVLRKVGITIQTCCERPGDLAARFGGEEFVVLLPSNARQDASGFGEKLRRNIEHLGIAHEGSAVGVVTISVGAASTQPRQGDSFLQLVDAADVALYEAKRSGKNRVVAREGANVAVMAASRGSAA